MIKSRGRGTFPYTFHLANPWLDYAGCWTARANRHIIIEAKTTKHPTLSINRHGGITESQWKNLQLWEAAGSICLVAWQHEMRIRIVTPDLIKMALADTSRVSIRWCDAIPCIPGHGWATDDILKTAELLT